MIRQSSYIISVLLHFLIFFVIFRVLSPVNYIKAPPEEMPLIALTFKKVVKESRDNPIVSPAPTRVIESKQEKKEIKKTIIPQEPQKTTIPTEPVSETAKDMILPEVSGNIVYAAYEDIIFEEDLSIPIDDYTLNTLLIDDGAKEKRLSHELYTIEFLAYESRRILNSPDILLDYTDPVLSTLANCKISFKITREGLVENIVMMDPGSGSKTYDKIIEDLMVQLLFEPGWEDKGIIFINFALISGYNHE